MPENTKRRKFRKLVDTSLAVGLSCILLVIYVGDHLLNRGNTGITITTTDPPPKPLRLAVTPPEFDDMGKLLGEFGAGYKYTTIPLADLQNPARLSEFDILFFTCGEAKSLSPVIKDNLRNYVEAGGTLYASDLRFDVIAEAFPEFVDPVNNAQGVKQDVKAEVVDTSLQQVLGLVMPLHFDEAGWRPAAFKGQDVRIFLKGNIQTNAGITIACPLLVQFPFGEGNVVFTSFHNEKQQKGLEEKLLKHLVLTTVTARTQSKIAKTMITGGFSPQAQNLLSTSKGDTTISKTYYNKDAEQLQFVLGFENQGANMLLTVQGPDGKQIGKEGTSTFTIDVTKAAPGEWKYTITALKIPYPNFPFTLTVGGDTGKTPVKKGKDIPITRTNGEPIDFKELKPVTMKSTKLRLAVTPVGSDNIGLVLRKLGEGYQFTDVPITLLTDARRLGEFDVVFVNCGGTPPLTPETRDAVRTFVAKGGTIYASDLQFPTLQHTFPELVSQEHVDSANPQSVEGDVLDAGLKDAIGKKMSINFNAGGWRTAAFGGRPVTVLVAGNYKNSLGITKHSPLLVKFPHDEGTVIFTSFHNSAQNTDTVVKVLEYLVFTAVTAKVQATVTKTMEASGFFPKQEGLFSHSVGNPKITRSYQNKKVGPLQFALGLQDQGARMKFTITAPGGQTYHKEVTSTITIEVPAAPTGEWLYTVERLQVPYANFPFTVTVGEKQK